MLILYDSASGFWHFALFSTEGWQSGRRGNTMGTYVCSNLRCVDYITGKKKPEGIRQMDETLTVEQHLERMLENAQAFTQRLIEAT